MEAAVSSASWLLGKVLNKLSEGPVAAYVSSKELGLNYEKIETQLLETQAVLHVAQQTDVSDNPSLHRLLQKLSNKADEAEDALDELHYFMIQDELDGTREAVPDLGDGLSNDVQHVRHAVRHTAGNWFSCFSCCHKQADADADVAADKNNPHNAITTIKSDSSSDQQALPFDRVAMSNKIKELIDDLHSQCEPIIKLLQINPSSKSQQAIATTLKRPITCAAITQNKLYGRDAIFNRTIDNLTGGMYHETLSVVPIVGPGGIGKTTFTQHLYDDERIKNCFPVRIWVCVSNNFDVLKLTQEILSCIPADEKEDTSQANNISNLSQLHEHIEKRLKSKSFLIVFDDIWECKNESDWDKLLAPLKKGETKGNMVLVTTRFPKIANMVKKEETNPIKLQGLEPDEFWKFFQDCVFGEVKDEQDMDELIDIAKAISDKLRCSPLAAKTVGPMLWKNHSRENWIRILNKKEWESLKHSDDSIMPALKISYDYLPFNLKKCFSHCALFPEDHRFDKSELTRFWDAIGIIDTSSQTDGAEDLVEELVEYGFFIKHGHDDRCHHYVLHDLLHELAKCVSSQECVNISFSSSFIAENIPQSVRHLSVTMQDKCSDNIEEEMDKLKRRIDIGNLWSLMVFGEYKMERTVNILKHTFKDIKCLRVLFIFVNSLDSLPHNFLKLIHLRYLKISSSSKSEMYFPSALINFYHLKFLDLRGYRYRTKLIENTNRLCNLHHFLDDGYIYIPEVGKMKHLQELKIFDVKKESVGFELRELGSLTELGGELSIRNLEKVKSKEEASEARLIKKRNINGLRLDWNKKEQFIGAANVLDGLQPHSNLKILWIINAPGVVGPSWLCDDVCLKNLESLKLEDLSWITLPPFGQIPRLRKLILNNIVGLRQLRLDFSYGCAEKNSAPLKSIVLYGMPELIEWVEDENCLLFPLLESVECVDCPVLSVLPILGHPRPSTQDLNTPNLQRLWVRRCPNLSLPAMPHHLNLTDVEVDNGPEGCVAGKLSLRGIWLDIEGYKGDLAVPHLDKVKMMEITGDAPRVSLVDLQGLKSLRSIMLWGCRDAVYRELDDGVIILCSVKELELSRFSLTNKLLSNLFNCFPTLSYLSIEDPNEEGEEVLLQLPSSCPLQKFLANSCRNLLLPAVKDGGALTDLTSLRGFDTSSCGKIFSRWSMEESTQIINPLPASLKELGYVSEPSMQSMGLLSNLTSLTSLSLIDCNMLKIDGFNPLILCNLKNLLIIGCGSVAADLLTVVARTNTLPAGAFQLEYLYVDCISAVLVAPICRRLAGTLKLLAFSHDNRVEGFTEEQEQALQLLHSLQILKFNYCKAMRSLPEGLHRLPSLEDLHIYGSPKLTSLPKRGLPASLEQLYTLNCRMEFKEEVKQYTKEFLE